MEVSKQLFDANEIVINLGKIVIFFGAGPKKASASYWTTSKGITASPDCAGSVLHLAV